MSSPYAKQFFRTQDLLARILFLLFLFLFATHAQADAPLLSLEVDSVILDWQDEFVLKLNIYGPEDMKLPPVTIDGIDQFQLQGTGKNLLEVPRGKTKKWVLTYTLYTRETGNFKVGPAVLTYNGRTYRSNILFLSVDGPEPAPQPKQQEKQAATEEKKKAPAEPPKKGAGAPVEAQKQEKKEPVEKPKTSQNALESPLITSASKIGDRILILMETPKNSPFQFQGIPVTVRLLSQLPVENLQFLEEADFPGFLRYDFPFTAKPRGEILTYNDKVYVSYELVKFLLFPLEGGEIEIPRVLCALRVRVRSGAFPEADLKLNVERSSNILNLKVAPSPEGAVVGDFVFKNEIVADEPESKVLRMIMEGKGQLSTFNFPEIAGTQFMARKLTLSTTAKMEGENLISRKVQDVEIVPQGTATSVVLPEVRVSEFDPETSALAALRLPPMRFEFRPPGSAPKTKQAFPTLETGRSAWVPFLILGLFTAFIYLRKTRLPRPKAHFRLHKLFSNKNMKMQISKSMARSLYQEIAMQIGQQKETNISVNDAITKYLPKEEWLSVQRGLRKLERMAYSATVQVPLTYEELKRLCDKIETLWIH